MEPRTSWSPLGTRRQCTPLQAHPRRDTASLYRSWLRAPRALRWPRSSVPENVRSAGADRPWQRRARGRPLKHARSLAHRPLRERTTFATRAPPGPAPGPLLSAPAPGSAPAPLFWPMGGQGGQRRWGLPRLPGRMALWPGWRPGRQRGEPGGGGAPGCWRVHWSRGCGKILIGQEVDY